MDFLAASFLGLVSMPLVHSRGRPTIGVFRRRCSSPRGLRPTWMLRTRCRAIAQPPVPSEFQIRRTAALGRLPALQARWGWQRLGHGQVISNRFYPGHIPGQEFDSLAVASLSDFSPEV